MSKQDGTCKHCDGSGCVACDARQQESEGENRADAHLVNQAANCIARLATAHNVSPLQIIERFLKGVAESEGVVACVDCGTEAYSTATGEKIPQGPEKWRCSDCEGVVVAAQEVVRTWKKWFAEMPEDFQIDGPFAIAIARLTRMLDCDDSATDSADDPVIGEAQSILRECQEEMGKDD